LTLKKIGFQWNEVRPLMEPLVVLEYVARQTTSIADVWEEAIHEANL